MPRRPPPPRLEDVDPADRLLVGGVVDRVTASLRVFGDDVDPSEITRLLGPPPSRASRKGDELPGRYHRFASTGSWILDSSSKPTPQDLGDAISQLLATCSDDAVVWQSLTQRFSVDVFCGHFLDEFNRGFNLPCELLQQLSDRKLRLSFDIYAP